MKSRRFDNQRLSIVVVAAAAATTTVTVSAMPTANAATQQPAVAAASVNVSTASSAATAGIDALENKFFEHSYATEPLAHRLDRIDKMVFGEPRTGSDKDRLEQLMSIVPTSRKQTNASGNGAQTPHTAAVPTARSSTIAGAGYKSEYPAVTALEKSILGSSFVDDPIRNRLDRLEAKAYGQPTGAGDLSLRVSQLQNYAIDHNLATHDASSSVAKYVPPPAATATMAEKITWLEEQVYGRAVPDRSMFDRVRRLNLSVLPNDYLDFDGSVPENVNTLISAVELDVVDKLADASDGRPSPRHRYHALPTMMPSGGYTASTIKPRLNSTASILQDMGMPSAMNQIGVTPDQLATTKPGDDDSDNPKKKKKGKKSGFWHDLKESMQEGGNDIMGIPRFAYGDDPNAQ